EEQVVMMLQKLGPDSVYVGRGKLFSMFSVGGNVKLAVSTHAAAEPTLWPLGHDVRPAQSSLGAKSCTECHAPEAAFLFGHVTAAGALKTANVAVKRQYDFQKID